MDMGQNQRDRAGNRKDGSVRIGASGAAGGETVFYLAAPVGALLLRLFCYAATAFVLAAASFQLLWFVTIPSFFFLFWFLALFVRVWRQHLYAAAWVYALLAAAIAIGFWAGPALRSAIWDLLYRLL